MHTKSALPYLLGLSAGDQGIACTPSSEPLLLGSWPALCQRLTSLAQSTLRSPTCTPPQARSLPHALHDLHDLHALCPMPSTAVCPLASHEICRMPSAAACPLLPQTIRHIPSAAARPLPATGNQLAARPLPATGNQPAARPLPATGTLPTTTVHPPLTASLMMDVLRGVPCLADTACASASTSASTRSGRARKSSRSAMLKADTKPGTLSSQGRSRNSPAPAGWLAGCEHECGCVQLCLCTVVVSVRAASVQPSLNWLSLFAGFLGPSAYTLGPFYTSLHALESVPCVLFSSLVGPSLCALVLCKWPANEAHTNQSVCRIKQAAHAMDQRRASKCVSYRASGMCHGSKAGIKECVAPSKRHLPWVKGGHAHYGRSQACG